MGNKERCEDFVAILNAVCFDPFLFPLKERKEGDGFVLHYDEGINGGIDCSFIEGDKRIIITRKTWSYLYKDLSEYESFLNSAWGQFYIELTRTILLTEDCIGKLKEAISGCDINILSFKTIVNEGLKQIK